LIDLHIHSTASDGTLSPTQIVEEAKALGLEAVALTDHDTLAGYYEAKPTADRLGVELVCAIELSTKLIQPDRPHPKTVHLLGYFPRREPASEFVEWIGGMQRSRRERNIRLVEKLHSLGMNVPLDEVQARGRSMAGRPHFAQIMLEKGYVGSIQEAFDKYLDEAGQAYVEREEPTFAEGVRHILDGGGIPSLAHPVRLGKKVPGHEEELIRRMCKMGLKAIEAFHCDHGPRDTERYQLLARRYDVAVTGGSDFHGELKPDVKLGTGRQGNVSVPNKVLDRLRAMAAR